MSAHDPRASGPATPTMVVIGAGIAGLAAAHRLATLSREADTPLRVIVLEASARLGGTIETDHQAGLTLERGPDSMVTEKPWGVELCEELGLADAVISTNPENRRSFIVRAGALHPVPEGFHLLAPSMIGPLARSPIFSLRGKLRMAAEPFIRARRDGEDESLASFVRRRLGSEVLDRIAQPMVGGIYTADPEKLSLRATMPRFLEMEQAHGSVIRAMMKARRRARGAAGTARGPRYDLFVSMAEGMEQLPRKLAESLPEGSLRTNTRVNRVERRGNRWLIETNRGAISADGVCMAAPAYEAARMLRSLAPAAAAELDQIEYASSVTINLAYRREDIAHPLDGFGFVVPAAEKRFVLACTFSSNKYAGRAPDGTVLLRTFVGGALFPQNVELDDRAIGNAAVADLTELLGIKNWPRKVLVSRYPRSMPQYHVGHLDRMDRIDAALSHAPGLALAGSAYRGTGIPDCVRGARAAAESLFMGLRASGNASQATAAEGELRAQ